MQQFEYKIVPAPTRGQKGPGIKGAEARFAYGLENAINLLATEGWEYIRADILPSEERQGLTSSQTVYRSVLVFRRTVQNEAEPVPVAQHDVDPETVEPETEEPSSDRDDADETEKTDDPSSKVQEHALSSLYASSDNSKQD